MCHSENAVKNAKERTYNIIVEHDANEKFGTSMIFFLYIYIRSLKFILSFEFLCFNKTLKLWSKLNEK